MASVGGWSETLNIAGYGRAEVEEVEVEVAVE